LKNKLFRAAAAFALAAAMVLPSAPVLAVSQTDRLVRDTQIGGERSRLFDDGWKFKLAGSGDYSAAGYDDSAWQDISVPHDWTIYDVNNLYTNNVGWYRKTFYLSPADKGRNIAIRFDGVYMNSTVYINGQQAGNWPAGWTTFQMDITDKLNFGNTPNVVAVKVDYKQPSAWWFTGAGIQRDVWLVVANPVQVNFNGTYISTKSISSASGTAVIQTEVLNKSSADASVTVAQTITDAAGGAVAASESAPLTVAAGKVSTDTQQLTVPNPKLWSIDSPNLYMMKTEIKSGGVVVDTYTTSFGFRTFVMNPNNGLFVNGQYVKIHGVCLHTDLGALGAAMNYAALEDRLKTMKAMGVNAIRTSHNVASPILIEMCDRLGLLVMDEGFVRWLTGNTYDYHLYFSQPSTADMSYLPEAAANPQWSEVDCRNWVKRDRNHPCVLFWSIGNEVGDTTSQTGYNTGVYLKNIVKSEDPNGNAAVTIASNQMGNSTAVALSRDALEAAGYNYGEGYYDSHHAAYPNMVIYGSETSSAVRSRGVFHTPANQSVYTYFDNQVSSYDNSVVPWGRSAESSWVMDRDRQFCLGQFIWTGYDYIGEPTPYGTKNSYFGIVDTAGLPKDIYYFYQSVWTDKSMVHLLPYWDSSLADDNNQIQVWAYSNAASVELFKDGVSLGRKAIDLKAASVLHYSWNVPYSDGQLTAKAYDASGNVVATDSTASFGAPAQVKLSADRAQLTADGKDLVYVTASIQDANGQFVATARNKVRFTVSGAGKLVGVDNGDSTDYDSYQAPERSAFSGKVVAIVESDGTSGPITINANSLGIASGSVTVQAVHQQAVAGIALGSIDGSNAITSPLGTLKMDAAVSPNTADFEQVAYTVSEIGGGATDKAIIGKDGVLKAFKNGQVLVTATALDGSGVSASAVVNISGQAAFTAVSGITVTGSSGAITAKSGKLQLTANVAPTNAAVKDVTWSVRNKSGSGALCASVDNSGLVQALYDGAVTVRAAALDGSGVYGEYDVAISGQSASTVPINKIQLSLVSGSQSLTADSPTVKLSAAALPLGASGQIDWSVTNADGSSSNSAHVVSVDASGVATVTASRNGTFYIMASTKNGGQYPQAWARMAFTASGLVTVTVNPYNLIKARDNDANSGGLGLEGNDPADQSVGGIGSGSWLCFANLDFGLSGSQTVQITGGRASSGSATIEIHDGSVSGPLLATLSFATVDSSNWLTLATREFTLTGLTGAHDLYFVFTNGGFLFYGFQFTEKAPTIRNPYATIKANTYDLGSKSNFNLETDENAVGNIQSGDYLQFNLLDFGQYGSKSVTFTGGCDNTYAPGIIEIHDGSATGALIASLSFAGTGGWQVFNSQTFNVPALTGVHNLCFVFPKGAFLFDSFSFAEIEHDNGIIQNIFLNKLAKASSENVGDNNQIASHAVDGVTDNVKAHKWCASSGSYPQWLEVDLGSLYDLYDLHLVLENDTSAFKYTVAVSSDPADWNAANWSASKTVIDESGNTADTLRDFTLNNVTGRYVRVTFTEQVDNLWAVIVNIAGSGKSHNIALNKPASADSEWAGQLAAMANNDIINDPALGGKNQWCANNQISGPHWWQTDLGGVYALSSFELTMEGDYGYAFQLQGSLDGVNYAPIADVTGGQKVIDLTTNAYARYLRVYNITAGQGMWPVIQNFAAYGGKVSALPAYTLSLAETPAGAAASLAYATDTDTPAKLIVAAYDASGVLLQIQAKDITLSAANTAGLAIAFDKAKAARVDAYLWGAQYNPLCDKALYIRLLS